MQTQTTTTGNPAGTARIDGRNYSIEHNDEPTFESSISKYGELVLHGSRGARYISERWHGTHIIRFWNDRVRSLPGVMFDGLSFVIEEGPQGHQVTLRPATYQEATAAYKIFAGRNS